MKITPFLLGLACVLASCSEKTTTAATPPPPAASAALLNVFAVAPAGEPAAIHKVRATVKPGDTLTLKGRVMGSSSPFVEGRAAFVLGDPEKLTPCDADPDDGCETPWDTCCDTAEDIKAGTATIQIVDADGKVLKEPLENVNGLKKMSTIIVSGLVAEGSNADLLVVNANAIKIVE